MKPKPLTKEQIQLAMRMTKSNKAAAKYLGVSLRIREASPMPLTLLNDLKANRTKIIDNAIMIAETRRKEAQLGNPH